MWTRRCTWFCTATLLATAAAWPTHPETLLRVYDGLLQTHPLPTRIVTASTLAFAGDAVAQRSIAVQPHFGPKPKYSFRRAASFVTVEATYRSLLQPHLLQFTINTFQGSVLGALAKRVAFNMFVVSTLIYYPLFFSCTGLIQGLTVQQTFRRARLRFRSLFGFNLCFWLPVQALQFAVVPTIYKVPFICLAGFLWTMILSALAGSVAAWRGSADDAAAGSSDHQRPCETDHHVHADPHHVSLTSGTVVPTAHEQEALPAVEKQAASASSA